MKKRNAFLILLLSFYFLSGNYTFAQKVPDTLITAFSSGNAEVLSQFFHERLQVNIMEQEFMCSNVQAKEIMRDFFSKNKPESFVIIHGGGKTDSNFSIGTLVTKTGKYRVNIFFKKIETKNLVHLIRIEKDDGRAF